MPLTPAQKVIRDKILDAPDVVLHSITEPTAGGFTRPTTHEYSSPTVEVGKKYCVDITYAKGPNDPAWGAASSTDENIR